MKALKNFGGFHRDDHAGSVIDRAGAEIPGIEMARDNHDLFGMLGALEVGDHVVTGFIRKLLRGEREPHADFALRRQMGD